MLKINRELVVCVGAQKAATTTLFELMKKHPDVCTTLEKETGFFYEDSLFVKGRDWFFSTLFQENSGKNVFFEADPNYMCFGRCIERIFSCDPNARIIVILRNPIDRAFSHYLMMKNRGMESLSFKDACESESIRICKGEWELADFGYLERSKYSNQIEHILRVFPRKQVLFIKFEKFIKNQSFEFTKVQEWLGLSPVDLGNIEENIALHTRCKVLATMLNNHRYKPLRRVVGKLIGVGVRRKVREKLGSLNHTRYKSKNRPQLSDEMREVLLNHFEADIKDAERLSGLDLSDWFLYK